MANIEMAIENPAVAEESDDSISFVSLVRKLSAFTVLVFMFHFAVPLMELNRQLVLGMGIEQTWYASIPLALFIAGMNSLIAILAFKFVK